jgi:hypothetical protein
MLLYKGHIVFQPHKSLNQLEEEEQLLNKEYVSGT